MRADNIKLAIYGYEARKVDIKHRETLQEGYLTGKRDKKEFKKWLLEKTL